MNHNNTPPSSIENEPKQTHLIWDTHTRLFHWLLVLMFSFSIISGLLADIDLMEWHLLSGYAVLGLLAFRVLTGLFGRDFGRFSRLPIHPRSVLDYLRGKRQFVGHNPLGSWMVIALLLSLAAQSLSGLLTTDEFLFEGPWVYRADDRWIDIANSIHHNNWVLLLVLVVCHILAVMVYRFGKRQDLITPMLTGKKQLAGQLAEQASTATRISLWRLSLLLGSAAGLTWAAVTLP